MSSAPAGAAIRSLRLACKSRLTASGMSAPTTSRTRRSNSPSASATCEQTIAPCKSSSTPSTGSAARNASMSCAAMRSNASSRTCADGVAAHHNNGATS